MAVFVHHILALAADDKDARSGFDDIVSDCLELVDSHDPLDLWKQSFEQTEVATSDSLDSCDRLGVGEVIHVERCPETPPLAFENEEEFVAAE